jgi:23S rRNA-/tRNA-specific pseudouridylate synthase
MKLNILYEDQDLLVINKPSNLVVNRATTIKAETIQGLVCKKIW